jgi:hypothetical protein
MGGANKDGDQARSAIPLTAGAIVTAQITMAAATFVGDKLTISGIGRKPLFLAGLCSLPVRCALIIWLKDAGDTALLFTQIFDGLGGGLIGLVHPYLVADITFGTGRFNVLSEYSVFRINFCCFCALMYLFAVMYSFSNAHSCCLFDRSISGRDRIVLWSRSDAFQLLRTDGGGEV